MESDKIKKLLIELLENKTSRELLVSILEYKKELSIIEHQRDKIETKYRKARTELVVDFNLTFEEEMAIMIALRMKEIEDILKEGKD